jgi:hypothetical protein
MPARTRPEPFIERPDLSQSHRAECHVCAEDASNLDYLIAVVCNRQIEIDRHRADFLIGIFFGQDSAFHAGELAVCIEKLFHRIEVARGDDQIVVEENQQLAGCIRNRAILDTAFSRLRFVQMLDRRESFREMYRRRRAIFSDYDLAGSRCERRRETRQQPRERGGAGMSRDYD